MSRRAGSIGLIASILVLVLTLVIVAGVGPSLPGPPVRGWLGLGKPPLPDLCDFDPARVRNPEGKPQPGRWAAEPNSPSPSPELGAANLGGFIYLVGGQLREGTERTLLRFDPEKGEYRREPDLPVALDHPVVAVHGGELIVASGYAEGTDATDRAWAYSPRSRRWRELAPLRTARGAAAGAVVGDRLYIAGGLTRFGNEYRPLRSMEIYDFNRRRWLRGPAMPTARHHFGAAALDGRIYFAGGRRPLDLSLDSFEQFDPATGRWRRLPNLPIGAGAPAVAAAAGEVVVSGGGEDVLGGGEGGWVLRASYGYEPAGHGWTRLPDMGRARHGHAAAGLAGRVYVFRGIPCPGYGQMSSVESLAVD